MEYKRFKDYYVVKINRGEDINENLLRLAKEENIRLGTISGIGACDHAVVGVYSVDEQKYYKNEFNEELELTSLNGNLSTMNGEHYLHVHANFSRFDGTVVGGHLNEGRISGTSEIFIHLLEGEVDRYRDEVETGLNLLDLR